LPKRGFLPPGRREEFEVINLKALDSWPAQSVIDPRALLDKGLIKKSAAGRIKVLGDGDLAHAVTVKAHAVSASARRKIEARGGRVELLGAREGPQA
jgi:large subunit ribosomal protein L15